MLARSVLSIAVVAALVAVVAGASSCRALEPKNRPLDTCEASCNARASRQCSEAECARGCEFILDRLVEREGDAVIRCVASASRRCTDVVWADCAAKVGVHADGGPPAPPPPPEDD